MQIDRKPDDDKYLTKKILLVNEKIFYASDRGKIFYYNIISERGGFVKKDTSDHDNPAFIGTPVRIGNIIYCIDINVDTYYLKINDLE